MSTVAERIRGGIAELTAKERRVARHLLANYPVAGLQTVAQLASDAGVSGPTVLRFLSHIGYSAHGAFQQALREELEAQLKSPLAKNPPLAAGQSPSEPATLAFSQTITENISQTFANIPASEFDATTRLLADHKNRIHVVGGRFTDALARYMAAHLRIVRPRVEHMAGQEANWRDQVIDFSRADTLVVFDIRRYQTDLFNLSEAAAERRANIVLMTDQWLSPIAQLARHVFAAHIAAPSAWDSSAALMAVSEAILAEVTQITWPTSEGRIRAIERLREGE
ncbi:MAG: MurR/RpiR family transcriptional regulator [Rhizobiales bacterium]|nr:MurR/RpiR family transcriptional regulator [Hyphomicrobiales bacterium]